MSLFKSSSDPDKPDAGLSLLGGLGILALIGIALYLLFRWLAG